MNRDIKFRQYLGNGRWHYFGFLTEKSFNDMFFAGVVAVSKKYSEVEKGIQQYTGLKDINDNEIYEGDIVQYKSRVRYNIDGKSHRIEEGVVIWKDFSFMIDMIGFCYDNERYYSINQRNIKVVGNVYEGIKKEGDE